jgi:hypothetical protein
MDSVDFYDKFNKFAEDHSVVARLAAPAVALYEGIKWSFGVPRAALDHATDAIAMATFKKVPPRGTSRLTATLTHAFQAAVYLAISPVASPLIGAVAATVSFLWIVYSPTTFGQIEDLVVTHNLT